MHSWLILLTAEGVLTLVESLLDDCLLTALANVVGHILVNLFHQGLLLLCLLALSQLFALLDSLGLLAAFPYGIPDLVEVLLAASLLPLFLGDIGDEPGLVLLEDLCRPFADLLFILLLPQTLLN